MLRVELLRLTATGRPRARRPCSVIGTDTHEEHMGSEARIVIVDGVGADETSRVLEKAELVALLARVAAEDDARRDAERGRRRLAYTLAAALAAVALHRSV